MHRVLRLSGRVLGLFGICLSFLLPVRDASAVTLPKLEALPQSLIQTVAHERCGVSSGNFARTCRPGSYNQCMGAAKRGVAGFTAEVCERRRAACSTCLGAMFACFKRIGHTSLATCDTCKWRFDICYRMHWR